MKYSSILLTFLFSCIIFSCSNAQKQWVEYKSEKSGFKVEFPKTPFENNKTLDTEWGSVKITMLGLDCMNDKTNSNFMYLLSYSEYPDGFFDGWTNETYEEYFKITIQGVVNKMATKDGKLLESKLIDFHGYQGREVKISHMNGSAINKCRIFIKGNKMFNLLVSTNAAKDNNPDIQKYFDSFELLSFASLNTTNPNSPAAQDIKSWLAGNTIVYNSNGNPKSKDLIVQIKYLSSWQVQDSKSPIIVKRFMKPIGSNTIGSFLKVKKFENSPTKESVANIIKDHYSSFPSNTVILSKNNNFLIDGERVVLVELKTKVNAEQSTEGEPSTTYYYDIHKFYQNYLVQITYYATGKEDNDELHMLFTDYKELFKMAASSFVIQSKWQ